MRKKTGDLCGCGTGPRSNFKIGLTLEQRNLKTQFLSLYMRVIFQESSMNHAFSWNGNKKSVQEQHIYVQRNCFNLFKLRWTFCSVSSETLHVFEISLFLDTGSSSNNFSLYNLKTTFTLFPLTDIHFLGYKFLSENIYILWSYMSVFLKEFIPSVSIKSAFLNKHRQFFAITVFDILRRKLLPRT